MRAGRTTLSKFLIDQLSDAPEHVQLAGLLVDIAAAVKGIAAMTAKGALPGTRAGTLESHAREEILHSCDWGGSVAGLSARGVEAPYEVPAQYKRGRYLLLFDALSGAGGFDVDMPVGTLFSVLPHAPAAAPGAECWLQPGRAQVAAGYALYGPATMLVLTVGKGTHGFTLDREIGNFILTHANLRVPCATSKFAINSGNERWWEPPVQRYVSECRAGRAGVRERDFSMRWIASRIAELHRVLLRGGVFMSPRNGKDPGPEPLRLLHEASPLAMIVEQAGGLASTGRERLGDVTPSALDASVPAFLGSREEVERIERYHQEFDAGTDQPYESPLFKERSLYREGLGTRS